MKREQIDQIIRKLIDNMLPKSQRDTVLRWLIGEQDASEKEEILFQLWNEMDTRAVSKEETQKALETIKDKLHLSNHHKHTIRWVHFIAKYAAIFLLPLITGLVVWEIMNKKVADISNMIECYVPAGEQKAIQLPDGTEVLINSSSLLIYPKKFHGDYRRIHLSGEAYFKVKHDENMPFIVGTGPLNIKVLGTQFNVESYPEDECITTTLDKGSVKVYRNNNEATGIIMIPEDKLIYHNKNNTFELTHKNTKEASAWTQGEICLEEQPLFYILKTLERRYNVKFHYGKHIDTTEIYTLKFKQHEKIEEIMNVLSLLIEHTSYEINQKDIFLFKTKEKSNHTIK